MKSAMKFGMYAIVASALLFSSCKKDKEIETDLTSAEDQSQGEMVYDQVFKQVDESATTAGLGKGTYPIVTIDSSVSPTTMRIYYGETNFLCKDGNYRRGAILVSWTGRYRAEGTAITISFSDFYQNDNKVEGTKIVTNTGRNAAGNLTFSIVVSGKVTNAEGKTHTWNSNRTRTWIEGESTLEVSDDVYEIGGNTNGVNRNGLTYTSKITKNLRVVMSCEWRVVSGTVEVTPEGKSLRTIDFGTGACDRLVTVSVDGKSKTFERRK
jgi:hypothetical protein